MQELTIVWQRARSSVWEDEWVEYLFKDIPHKTIENLDHTQFIDNSVIVDAICWAPYHNAYINTLASKGYKFGMVHLTDESTQDDISSYDKCKFVLRNYYRGPMPEHVMHIPLGWNTGFTDYVQDKTSSARQYTWAFVGARWDQNRNDMSSAMSSVPNGSLYVADHTGPRLAPAQMGRFYSEAIFVPCPRGAIIIDSFRVTEALEAGCIPIVERSDYWFDMHGKDFPAIQVDNWLQAPAIIRHHLNNPSKLEALRILCKAWWDSNKYNVNKKVNKLVGSTMI
jgi:hypothetical protein